MIGPHHRCSPILSKEAYVKNTRSENSAYAEAGVDIDAQETALSGIKELVRSTQTEGVLSELGGFGGLFKVPGGYSDPILVSSADGVGTKLMVAAMANDYSSVGADLVNHCVNDILVQGARPLFFMDYVGAGVLEAETMERLVGGVARACKENDCALLGGETAEMPGFYQPGDYELVGFIVGIVDRAELLDGSRIEEKDLLIGLPSAGLHTNGFSLARRAILERRGLGLGDLIEGTGQSVKEALLAPHLSYRRVLEPLLGHPGLRGLAHITGGGLLDNIPRILPVGLQAEVLAGTWEVPPLFLRIQEWAEVATEEMFRVFNMGIGMVLAVAPEAAGDVLQGLRESGSVGFPIGTVQRCGPGVEPGVVLHLEAPLRSPFDQAEEDVADNA